MSHDQRATESVGTSLLKVARVGLVQIIDGTIVQPKGQYDRADS